MPSIQIIHVYAKPVFDTFFFKGLVCIVQHKFFLSLIRAQKDRVMYKDTQIEEMDQKLAEKV